MSAIVRTRPVKAMMFLPGKGAGAVEVTVYRDPKGGVVVRGEGGGARAGAHGVSEMRMRCEVRFPNLAAYEAAKAKAFDFNPVLYTKAIGTLGIDDDATDAPLLPEGDEWFQRGGAGDVLGTAPALAQATDNGVRPVGLLGRGALPDGVRPFVPADDADEGTSS